MPALTALLLVVSVALAVIVGPLTQPWMWGPAMLALALSSISATIDILRRPGATPSGGMTSILGTITAGWFAWRAWNSPVQAFAQADIMLLGAAVCAFINMRSLMGDKPAARIMAYGLALLLFSNIAVAILQIVDPSFSFWIFRSEDFTPVSGFLTHYNYGANFLMICAMISLGVALFSNEPKTLRLLMALLSAAAMVLIWLSGSRGGILACTAALGTMLAALLIIAYHNKAKWFPIAAIALPIIGIALVSWMIIGWQLSQQARTGSTNLDSMMDNQSRLILLGAAATCITLHPWTGGGSRSFLWEFIQIGGDHSETRDRIPEFVHNEWIQSATDYGIIGTSLIFILVSWILIRCLLRLLFSPNSQKGHSLSMAWPAAGLAASVGILLQSCFSFVFHIMPGALMLGICLAMASNSARTPRASARWPQAGLLCGVLIVGLIITLPLAWKGSLVTRTIASSHFSKSKPSIPDEEKITLMDEAIEIWPHPTLLLWQGRARQKLAKLTPPSSEAYHELLEKAAQCYNRALELNPNDGEAMVNLANTYSILQHDKNAEDQYQRLLAFQGKMERLFRANYFYSDHLYKSAIKHLGKMEYEQALETIQMACKHIDTAIDLTHEKWHGPEGRSLHVACHEMAGMLLEREGKTNEALAEYDLASTMHRGTARRIHLRAAKVIAHQAHDAWFARDPEKAYTLFLHARQRLHQAGAELPEGVTEQQRDALKAKIENAITILRTAGIKPE